MSAAPKWLTATPLVYGENLQFWDRDAGLLCLGLRQLGQDSRFVALGETTSVSTTQPLITGRIEDFHNPAWWRQWGATGVILNAWGTPRYEPVARAIKAAGLRLVVRLDSDGCNSPRAGFATFLATTYSVAKDAHRSFPTLYALAKALVYRAVPAAHDRGMAAHLGHADLITIESPAAAERFSRLLNALHRADLASRLRVLPHPVNDAFVYDAAVPRRKQILAVGRWESHQKDGPLLLSVLAAVLATKHEHRAVIVGDVGPTMERGLNGLPRPVRSRITLTGRVPNLGLVPHCQASQTVLVASRYESFHIAAAESLCCGSSVMGPAAIPSMRWFTSEQSGTLARDRSAATMSAALEAELAEWEAGRRDAGRISAMWCARVHVTAVAAEAMRLVGELPTSSR